MRVFFGIPIGENGQNIVNPIISELKEHYDGHYTLSSNLHITLTFVGEVEQKVPYMLSDIGDRVFSGLEKFVIHTTDIESFKAGKINYLGIERSEQLDMLHNSLNALLDEAGLVYTSEDEYTPHITLRRGSREPMHIEMESREIEIDRVCLYESKRVDDVLRYIPLATWHAEER